MEILRNMNEVEAGETMIKIEQYYPETYRIGEFEFKVQGQRD